MQQCPHCGEALDFSKPPRFCPSCGQPLRPLANDATQPYTPPTTAPRFAANEATPVPESVGGYRLLRALGEGGMGTVYEGEETTTGRPVAVKLIRAEFADSPDAIERFRREGRLASTIAHPRCVFVLAADEEAGRPYIVMERMPGDTLADLVEKNGPLSPPEAVARILDVIEGLQEAHHCGLIHRDVKPSNCFLDADGRVKVGDFGLSKSLVKDVRLTQTGAFLGTLLYAAPEQIRHEVVDQQADVYSVAATLYFLLTGRAPFQGTDDAAATLARTMTDPLTPMRKLRPELPTTLDVVVLRGLARDRGKRWRNLEDFRVALLPFTPGRHSLAEVGWRVGAFLLDAVLVSVIEFVLIFLVYLLLGIPGMPPVPLTHLLITIAATFVVALSYFAVPESLWGGSLCKLLLGLRVWTVANNDRPALWRALTRTCLFELLLNGGAWAVQLTALLSGGVITSGQAPGFRAMLFNIAPLVSTIIGLLLMASTMRRRNGYRALHDYLTGTVVIRLPSPRTARVLSGVESPLAPVRTPQTPSRLGAFAVQGLLCATRGDQLLLGEDSGLHRRVWLWQRALDDDLPPRRREVNRTTRPRWLAGGREGNQQWDAFVATPGFLLADALAQRPRLFWPEVLPIVAQLADELAAACADDTLPRALSIEHIWVETTGRVQLLDVPPRSPSAAETDPDSERRALALIRHVVAHALEGRPRAAGEQGPIRAPLPGRAADVLARLMTPGGFTTTGDFHAALEAARERPMEITRSHRTVQLSLLALALSVGLFWMLYMASIVTLLPFISSLQSEPAVDLEMDLLKETSVRDAAVLSSTPDPMLTLAGAVQYQADRRQLTDLEARRECFRQDRKTALQSCSWYTRRAAGGFEPMAKPQFLEQAETIAGRDNQSPREQIRVLDDISAFELRTRDTGIVRALIFVVPGMTFVPLAWALWAGATRGGIGLWFAGARLVQANGRRAARWRCGVRALLVWLPFLALLIASALIEVWRLTAEHDWLRSTGGAWLAWGTWWLAALLLPVYVWLALRSPNRGWHDRLVGTYLVPR